MNTRIRNAWWKAIDAIPDSFVEFVFGGARIGFWYVGIPVVMIGMANLIGANA